MTEHKSYKSAKDFRVALEHRLQKQAADSGFNLQRLRRTVAFNRFLARIFADRLSPWVLKGGFGRHGVLQYWPLRKLLKGLGCPIASVVELRKKFRRAVDKDMRFINGYF